MKTLNEIKPHVLVYLFVVSALTALSCGQALSQTAPKLLPFQGRLTDQNGVAVSNGVRLVQFKIFAEATGGSPVWAGELHRTTVNGGLVNVILGTKTPLTGVDFDRQLYLEITVDINVDSSITLADPPMLPRQAILPVIFAKEAAESRLLNGGDWTAVLDSTNAMLGKLLSSKLADGQVDSRILASNAILNHHVGVLSRLTSSDGSRTNALEINAVGGVHIDEDLLVDRQLTAGGIQVGSSSFGGQSLELRISNGQPPFLDFSNDPDVDFDARIILQNDDTLLVLGANLKLNEDLIVDRDISASKLTVGGTVIAPTGINVGSAGWNGQGLEIRIGNGALPFIDFSNDASSDFDMRLILSTDDTLLIQGGNVAIEGNLQVAQLTQTGSDRNTKTDFAALDTKELLSKVAALPIQTWRFTNEPPSVRHIGPTAQDFHAAFGCDEDNKHISTVDADGVALGAIQELHRLVKEKDAQISGLNAAIRELTRRVDALSNKTP